MSITLMYKTVKLPLKCDAKTCVFVNIELILTTQDIFK